MLEIRRAKQEDLGRIMGIYQTAQDYMISAGNPTQWGHSFPPAELIQQDIQSGICHLIVDGSTIHGIFALCEGEEPTYREIHDGAWLNDDPYCSLSLAKHPMKAMLPQAWPPCRERWTATHPSQVWEKSDPSAESSPLTYPNRCEILLYLDMRNHKILCFAISQLYCILRF